MQVKIVLDNGSYKPEKAYSTDAGFGLRTPKKVIVPARSSSVVETGVHIMIQPGYVGFLKSKSGLNMKDGILSEGVVDANYVGSIVVKLYNHSNKDKVFEKGDKITQLVILPTPNIEMVQVNSLEDTERGNNGFGSTGR